MNEYGRFVWLENMSTDPQRFEKFYAEAFGWTFQSWGEGDFPYRLCFAGEHCFGGMAPMPEQKKGTPSFWIPSISVEDCDATAQAFTDNGGRILKTPEDIPTVGRMCVVEDHQGVHLELFTAEKDDPQLPSEPVHGFPCWYEFLVPDVDKCAAFYSKVIGYEVEVNDSSPGIEYHTFRTANRQVAGIMKPPGEENPPAMLLVYFFVENCDETRERIAAAVGEVLMPGMDIPNVGRIAVFNDPCGAIFAIFQVFPRKE